MTVDEIKLQEMLEAQTRTLRAEFQSGLDNQSQSLRGEFQDSLNKQSKSLRTEFQDGFAKQSQSLRTEMRQMLELELAKFFGQFSRYFDAKFKALEDKLDRRVNDIYNLVDGFTNRMDNDDSERAAMNNDLNRHKTWIDELADHTGTQLSPP